MIDFAVVFIANVLFIGMKALQQRNVAFDNYSAIVPTSFGLALTEVYVIARIAEVGFQPWLIAALGFGGGLGCLFAMLMHKRYLKRPDH